MSSRVRTRGSFQKSANYKMDDDALDASSDDLGIDFSTNESGRMMTRHVVNRDDNVNDEEDADLGAHPQTSLPTKPAQQRSKAKAVPTQHAAHSGAPHAAAASSQASSHGSTGSGFISGIMNQGGGTNLLSHTPPSTFGSSYEVQHFGKRPRAGSISGRLRSASELEDKGMIDRQQKALLKDLIIAGDEDLQAALDEYEKGDAAQLESMLRSGELMNRAAAGIDLLGDLDLDFLTVDDHFGDESALDMTSGMAPPLASEEARSAPIPMPPAFPTGDQVHQMSPSHPNTVSPSAYEDDGIGDLEFNAEVFLPPSANQSYGSKQESVALADPRDQRFRSNSLAFGALLNETHGSTDSQALYGRWMDRDFPQSREGSFQQGGIGAMLAQHGRSKSDSALKFTKAQMAEEKRRLKKEKREQKEREKAEKKERREHEKKEREARDKEGRKERKYTSKAKQDEISDEEERMETPSGLGRPRSTSDPNLRSSLDVNGLLTVERPEGWVGAYSPESRKIRIERFLAKRDHRVWTKKVKYDVRKNFADSRFRVKGRFVKKEDELLMRDLMSLT